ncbi:hypothetical protein [Tianweitania sediminis]|uniref:Uncharacterized protein n=1 Tax=Tianweitania sediminis TaxID=1502156 RepID=A0A8J7RJU1_9HYPH|nr:hypothetical protein [Tianweitania sediminis]MBP0438576.1 hypothetical protein [Tianweitania sediminis]
MRGCSSGRDVAAWELLWLAGLVGFYLVAGLFGDVAAQPLVNFVGPPWLAAVLVAGAIQVARRNPFALWTGLFWMRLATATYFGIGSVAEGLMNKVTHAELMAFYDATEAEIAKFNLLAASCSLVILSTVFAAARVWPQQALPRKPAGNDRLMLVAAFLFGTVGFAVKYLFIFPKAMGALGEDTVLPGLLTQLVWLAPVATFLATLWCLRNNPRWLALVLLFVAADAFAGLLRFSKADALLPVLMFGIAVLQHRFSLRRLFLAVALAVATFPFLQMATMDGRAQLADRYGTIHTASFAERLGILSDFAAHGPNERHDELQGSLLRIAYVHAAAPALSLFDSGQAGNSLTYLPYLLVPRVLWPDKPLFDMGRDYTILLTGSETSSTWMGYFAEAYWNLGWAGVPLVMVPLGLIFFATGRYAFWTLTHGQWLHFPAVFLGMYMGARMDGLLAGDVGASLLTIAAVYPGATLLTAIVRDVGGGSSIRRARGAQAA